MISGRCKVVIYHRRKRETYAAFEGNRHRIDQQFGRLITAIVAAARGNIREREAVEQVLPELEAKGWHVAAGVRRMWVGEREWQALVENLNAPSALVVLRVLEMLGQGAQEE